MDQYEKRRVCVLVKAYPQPSQKYQETVCVAAVTEDHRLVRLYPIRFRQLAPEQRFGRFDWIEVEMARARKDPRPESFHVKEDSLRIVHKGEHLSQDEKVRLWKPSVTDSLVKLQEEQKGSNRSLGIVRPDPESVRFKYALLDEAQREEQELARSVYRQQSFLEEPLTPLAAPEYVFRYQFTSGGKPHTMQLHDWETETTYHVYKRGYGRDTLAKMAEYYEQLAPRMNLHLIMGTMHKRPWQFIIIGVLRTTVDVDHADAQGNLFRSS